MSSRLKPYRVLLLTTLATVCAHAQFSSVSPNLSPPLTTDPETAPITTLAIDLLAPQRSYIFDPTGASVSANALNPEIYSSTLSTSGSLTDTQLRDSSQTGHLSPYAGAARLGVSFSGSDDADNQGTTQISNGSFTGAIHGENGGQDSGTDSAYKSSWGTSSSFGGQSGEASWGTDRLRVNRLGGKQPESLTANPGLNGQLTTATNSTGSSSGYSIANSGGTSNANSINSLTRRYGGSALNSSRYAAMGARNRHSSSEGALGGVGPADTTTDNTMNGNGVAGGATNGASKSKKGAAQNALTFFPQAAYAQSPLGVSPFSSPGGVDELQFLNPNIFAATSQGRSLSLTEAGSAGQTQDSLRQAFVHRHTLPTSASHYGLSTHPAASRLKTGMGDKSTSLKRTHLNTGISDSDNP